MSSHTPSQFKGFDLETGETVLFFLKVGIVGFIFLTFGVGATSLLAAAACAAMGYEWFQVTTRNETFDEPILAIALAAASLPAFMTFAVGPIGGIIVALLGGAFLLQMGPKEEDRLLFTAPGIFLIGLAGTCFVWLRSDTQHGLATIAWLVLVAAATEVGSRYFSSRLNANKTASGEGTRGMLTEMGAGLACGVAAGIVVAAFYREGSMFWAIIASILTAGIVMAAGAVTDTVKKLVGGGATGSLFMGRGAVIENFDGLVCATIFASFLTLAGGPIFSW